MLNVWFLLHILAFVDLTRGASSAGFREAQLALLFLRASLDSTKATQTNFRFLDSSDTLTEQEALNFLEQSPKPIACSLEESSQILVIKCVPVVGPDLVRIHQVAQEHFVSGLHDDFKMLGVRATEEVRILVRGSGEQLVVTARQLEEYAKSYLILHAIGVDPPTPDQSALGIAVVWHVSGGQQGWSLETPFGTMRPLRSHK